MVPGKGGGGVADSSRVSNNQKVCGVRNATSRDCFGRRWIDRFPAPDSESFVRKNQFLANGWLRINLVNLPTGFDVDADADANADAKLSSSN